MRAIILAAGRGTRLRPFTDSRPKCLVDVGGITVLHHELAACLRAGVRDIVVITGFEHQQVETAIADAIATDCRGLTVRTVYNPFFGVANNMISLWTARHYMHEPFITINGDDVFTSEILSALLDKSGTDITVATDAKIRYDDDDMKVVINAEGHITQINKRIGTDANGESIGIMKFSGRGGARLSQELEAMARAETGMTDWYTKAIERIAQSGFEVGHASIQGMPWAEIDFVEDLEQVRRDFARFQG